MNNSTDSPSNILGVRAAQPAEIPQLVALMTEFYMEADFQLNPDQAARSFAQLLQDQRLGYVWLLEFDSKPAGLAVLTLSFSMEYGGIRGVVDDLFVRLPYRGKGLAAEALEQIKRTCKDLGVRAISVETGHENDTARHVYERAGFTATRRMLLTLPLADPVHIIGQERLQTQI